MGAARRRSRGHGPARLDGTRPRVTVADKGIKSGMMAGQATAASMCRPHASEARRGRNSRSEVRCDARQRSPAQSGTPDQNYKDPDISWHNLRREGEPIR